MSAVIAAVGVGVGVTIWSAHEQAGQIQAQAEFQAKMQEINARLAEVDAAEAYRQGAAQQASYIGEAEKAQAQQEAYLAQAGIQTNTAGAGADLVAESNVNKQLNLIDIENQAFMNASKFKREAMGRRDQAAVDRSSGQAGARNALISGYASAVSQGATAYAGYAGKQAGTSQPAVKGTVGNQSYWKPGGSFGSGGI